MFGIVIGPMVVRCIVGYIALSVVDNKLKDESRKRAERKFAMSVEKYVEYMHGESL